MVYNIEPCKNEYETLSEVSLTVSDLGVVDHLLSTIMCRRCMSPHFDTFKALLEIVRSTRQTFLYEVIVPF